MKFLPLITALVGVAFVVIARILTNKSFNEYRQRVVAESWNKMKSSNAPNPVENRMDEISQAFLPRLPHGTIPPLYSLISVLGYAVVGASLPWAYFSIGWCASAAIIVVYLLTGFIQTLLLPRIGRK